MTWITKLKMCTYMFKKWLVFLRMRPLRNWGIFKEKRKSIGIFLIIWMWGIMKWRVQEIIQEEMLVENMLIVKVGAHSIIFCWEAMNPLVEIILRMTIWIGTCSRTGWPPKGCNGRRHYYVWKRWSRFKILDNHYNLSWSRFVSMDLFLSIQIWLVC